jgi:hypothetical protein
MGLTINQGPIPRAWIGLRFDSFSSLYRLIAFARSSSIIRRCSGGKISFFPNTSLCCTLFAFRGNFVNVGGASAISLRRFVGGFANSRFFGGESTGGFGGMVSFDMCRILLLIVFCCERPRASPRRFAALIGARIASSTLLQEVRGKKSPNRSVV